MTTDNPARQALIKTMQSGGGVILKWLVVLVAVAVAFFAGHALAQYRSLAFMFELQRSDALNDASIMLRLVELLDKDELSSLRVRLLGHAEAEMEIQPKIEWEWWWVISEPFADQGSVEWLRARSDREAGFLRAEFERLCGRPEDAPTFTACGR